MGEPAPRADSGDHVVERGALAGDQRDARAVRSQRLGERPSQPSARSGDQSSLSFDLHALIVIAGGNMSAIKLIYWPETKKMPTRTPIDHLADNIKAIRTARGLSQQQIAKVAGIPRATWTNLESGAANPTLTVLVKVASALEIRLDELLAPPRQPARFLRVDELPIRQRGHVVIRKLIP